MSCKVVNINKEKCTNCHTCISVCPVKYCFIDKDKVSIDDNLCIGCGRCYLACPHGAIEIIDDFHDFLESVNSGQKMILIVSPVIFTVFKEFTKNLLGWFKDYFVLDGIYHEGVGAELSATMYMREIKKTANVPLISQQCPSIVEYIKIYKPELLKYLAPVQSPVIVLAKLIREIKNFKGNIAYLGPCISKRREFKDPDTTNSVQFNITIKNLLKFLELKDVNLEKYSKINFDDFFPERGSVFCKPGGFVNIIKRYYENPNMYNFEGKELYSKIIPGILDSINNNSEFLPIAYDVLNCEYGCFNGPGIEKRLKLEEELSIIDNIQEESVLFFNNNMKAQKYFDKILDEYEEKIDFNRVYYSDNETSISTLDDKELADIYNLLNKKTKKDFLNCKSCGFNSCREFATSMYFKINSENNCRVYLENKFKQIISENDELLTRINSIIEDLQKIFNTTISSINNLKSILQKITNQINSVSQDNTNLKLISENFQPIITSISEVSEQINLLSLNASIEASRSGEMGKSFAVVSAEIRNLADRTKNETFKITTLMKNMLVDMENVDNSVKELLDDSFEYETLIKTIDESTFNTEDKIIELTNQIEKIINKKDLYS